MRDFILSVIEIEKKEFEKRKRELGFDFALSEKQKN